MDGLIKGDNYMSECRAQQQLRHLHIINFLMIKNQQTVLNHVLFLFCQFVCFSRNRSLVLLIFMVWCRKSLTESPPSSTLNEIQKGAHERN